MKWVGGGAIDHLKDCLKPLFDFQALEKCGFVMYKDEAVKLEMGETHVEDEFAEIMFDFGLENLANRARRLLHVLRGWPYGMYDVVDRRRADAVIERFRLDERHFNDWLTHVPRSAALEENIKSSCFQMRAVKQLQTAFQDGAVLVRIK